jgi:DNA polymerase I-like protein with 3'-5' exonuclease and polymerase domains
MRRLIFWTASDYAHLEKAVGPVMRTRGVQNTTAEFDGTLLEPRKDEVVLAMGTSCLDVLKSSGLTPKNLGVNKQRGRVIAGEDGDWMVTLDPRMVSRDHQALVDIQWDTQLACRYLQTGSLAPPPFEDVQWCDDFGELIEEIKRTYKETGRRVRVFEDLETLGLYPWYRHAWIISISFTVYPSLMTRVMAFPKPGQKPTPRQLEQIRWIETSEMVSLAGANLKFDNVWKAEKWDLPSPTNFFFDTMIGGSAVDENRRNSLNIHTKIYTPYGGYDDGFNARHDKGRMDLVLATDPDGFLQYAGGDTLCGALVRHEIAKQLAADEWLSDFYGEILHPAAIAFEKIERRGILVNKRKLLAVGRAAEGEIARIEKEMLALVPPKVRHKYGDDFAFSKPRCVRDLFFSPSGWGLVPKEFTDKAPKAAKEAKDPNWAMTSVDKHLKMFRDDPRAGALIGKLKERGKAKKVLSTYVGEKDSGKGFLVHLRPDGKYHPTYALGRGSLFDQVKDDDETSGANTGRTAAKDPAIQTIPKRGKWAKPLRRCYPAPKGRIWFNNDFSEGELRIGACYANEPTMLEAYRQGHSLHDRTAAWALDKSVEEVQALKVTDPGKYDEVRSGAKSQNFALLFRQSPRGFMNYSYTEWDIVLTLEEAEEQWEEWNSWYPGILPWHDAQIAFAREHGYVRSPLGRVRHLPMIRSDDRKEKSRAQRQSINSPVQGTLSDLGLWSIGIAENEADLPQRGMEIVLFTHDALSGYVPDTSAGLDMVRDLRDIMENLPFDDFGWEPQIPFPVDMEVGPTLGDLEKLT